MEKLYAVSAVLLALYGEIIDFTGGKTCKKKNSPLLEKIKKGCKYWLSNKIFDPRSCELFCSPIFMQVELNGQSCFFETAY